MSTPINNSTGGPAFPMPPEFTGMQLRDWFAGQALAGYLASFTGAGTAAPMPDSAARYAYRCADAMIAERAEKGGVS